MRTKMFWRLLLAGIAAAAMAATVSAQDGLAGVKTKADSSSWPPGCGPAN